MTDFVKFEAIARENSGKGAARAIRRDGRIPAIIYGGSENAVMVSLPMKELNVEINKGGFRTKLVELTLNGKQITVLPKELQKHPVTDAPEHLDFLRVGKDTIVVVAVPMKVVNEDKSIGIKKGGIVNLVHRTFDFECHPTNIPHAIEVDVSNLDIGGNLHINDITLPKGITPVDKTNFTVASLNLRAEEKEPEAGAVDTAAATPAAGAAPAAAPAADKGKK
ncbi:MAG: 50S ribosomal protein L25/general stress protein Ctc [Rickettsiales bacterium]